MEDVDVSSYLSLKNSGVKYYDYDGNELGNVEYFTFLKSCGVNYIRLRVWNDPYDSDGNGYGGVDVEINENDIRIDVMRASGNGGQCVNTTDSAVRLTHIPTGIVIYSQTEKSQLQNKAKAFALLRSKLYDMELQKQHDAEAADRKSQIGTGDRSEKIRTYNFPEGRVTDHRIKLTLYKLEQILNGDLNEIIDSLIAADQAAKLSQVNEEE